MMKNHKMRSATMMKSNKKYHGQSYSFLNILNRFFEIFRFILPNKEGNKMNETYDITMNRNRITNGNLSPTHVEHYLAAQYP